MPPQTLSKVDMTARCSCGSVELDVRGAPFMGVACYCNDCQEGARQIEALADAPPVRNPAGGTAYLLYRRDASNARRERRSSKAARSERNRTRIEWSPPCNSAMLIDFEDSKHWVPVCRARFRGNVPPPEMRICTETRPENTERLAQLLVGRGRSSIPG